MIIKNRFLYFSLFLPNTKYKFLFFFLFFLRAYLSWQSLTGLLKVPSNSACQCRYIASAIRLCISYIELTSLSCQSWTHVEKLRSGNTILNLITGMINPEGYHASFHMTWKQTSNTILSITALRLYSALKISSFGDWWCYHST